MLTAGIELKTLWGVVNAAHPDFADVAEAVTWAQTHGYRSVYVPAGEYELQGTTIDIYTPHFTLKGDGAGSLTDGEYAGGTLIRASETCASTDGCAITVRPLASDLISGVRLEGFTIQRAVLTGGPYSYTRQGGLYLKDCRQMWVERVHADNWSTSNPPGYGFKAYNSGLSNKPAGGIVFDQCGGEEVFYGVWLSGEVIAQPVIKSFPMQRCSLIDPSFKGVTVTKGTATGGSSTTLVDSNNNFYQAGVQPGQWVHDLRDDSIARVNNIPNPTTLQLTPPGWQYGMQNICRAGDPYIVAQPVGYGVYVENAKGTLVLGGAIAVFARGIHIGDAVTNNLHTHLSQIIGPKFDDVSLGVYIGSQSDSNQVVAMTRAAGSNHVQDNGTNSLVVGHVWNRLPADVDVNGILDSAIKQASGAGIRTYSTSGDSFSELGVKFGSQDSGFIGCFTIGSNNYLIARINGVWYNKLLDSV